MLSRPWDRRSEGRCEVVHAGHGTHLTVDWHGNVKGHDVQDYTHEGSPACKGVYLQKGQIIHVPDPSVSDGAGAKRVYLLTHIVQR